VDDITPNNDNNYHHTSNVYAGASTSDIVDNTFTEILLRNGNMKAYYKFGSSTEFLDQVPLSSAFFDSNSHKFKLSTHHARMFIGKKCYLFEHMLLICYSRLICCYFWKRLQGAEEDYIHQETPIHVKVTNYIMENVV
jgi:hypothetical protein